MTQYSPFRRHFLKATALTSAGIALSPVWMTAATAQSNSFETATSPADLLKILPDDIVLGDPNAPVTLFVHESMTCPHCASFHTDTYPELKEKEIDTGRLNMVIRDFPLDGIALRASLLTYCVPKAQHHQMAHFLMQTQAQWVREGNPLANLKGIALQAGITGEKFDACMADEKLMEKIVAGKAKSASLLNIQSTPTFLFSNGERIEGNRPYRNFKKVIDSLVPDKG